MKVFCAGATGFVGSHLVKELRSRGHELKLLVYRQQVASQAGIEYVQGDIAVPETYLDELGSCDAVINLVGIIREFPARGVTFNRLHVNGAEAIVNAAEQAGVSRYLHMSALGTRPDAVSGYHRSKFQAECLVRQGSLEWTVFRPSLIYGPGDAFVSMLAGQIRAFPVIPVIGDGKYRLQPVSAEDVARCFAIALEKPELAGLSYELCGPDRYTYVALLDEIAAAIGRKAPLKVHVPLALMKAIIPVMQRVPRFPITMDQLQMLLEENICSCPWPPVFDFAPQSLGESIRKYLPFAAAS